MRFLPGGFADGLVDKSRMWCRALGQLKLSQGLSIECLWFLREPKRVGVFCPLLPDVDFKEEGCP